MIQSLKMISLKKCDLFLIDPFLLNLILPRRIQESISLFQRVFLKLHNTRIENKAILEQFLTGKLINSGFFEEPRAMAYEFITAIGSIRGGDHIASFDGKKYHHGIFLGYNNETRYNEVMVNSIGKCSDGYSVQCIKMKDFIANKTGICIFNSRCPYYETEIEYRATVIKIARLLQAFVSYNTLKLHRQLRKWPRCVYIFTTNYLFYKFMFCFLCSCVNESYQSAVSWVSNIFNTCVV
jgi:hypothetical protein